MAKPKSNMEIRAENEGGREEMNEYRWRDAAKEKPDEKQQLLEEYMEIKLRSQELKDTIETRVEEEWKWNESMEYHIMQRQLSDMLGYLTCLGLRMANAGIAPEDYR